MATPGDQQGDDRQDEQGHPEQAKTEVAGVQAEHLGRAHPVDRPVDRGDQRPDGSAGEELEQQREVQQRCHGDADRGDQQQSPQTGDAPGQDRAHDQAYDHHGDRHGERRIHGDGRSQHQARHEHLGPQAAEAGSGSGVTATDSVGGDPLRSCQTTDHPGNHGEGGDRCQPTGPQGVVGHRDGQVDQHGDRPGPTAAHRLGQPPDPECAHREGGEHNEGP